MRKKISAMFMVFLIACFSFTLYYPEKVEAANVDTCGMTADPLDRDFCIEVPAGSGFDDYGGCSPGHLYSYKTIEEVDECKQGTCVPQSGTCLSDKFHVECTFEQSGAWYDSDLSAVPDCQTGCCNFANSYCSMEEKKYCVHDLANDNNNAFLGTSYNTNTCDDTCRGAELGCYKYPGGGCKYGKRSSFNTLADYIPGNFYSDVYCRDVVGCFVESHSYNMCGDSTTDDDNLDVYYFDSALNREELAENGNCEYPQGMCEDPDGSKGEDAYCRSTNCVSGLEEDAEPGDFKSGESLCVDIHPYHYTNEGRSTGIKPYILTCQFGSILADASLTRDNICTEQTDESGMLHASTIQNNWNQCFSCGDGGGLLGNLGDVFGYLLPPFSSAFLVLTTRPCEGSQSSGLDVVWNGDYCGDRGKVGNKKMCGYGPLNTGDDYDNDVWEPMGSCNPLYPPAGTDKCGDCGKGGDRILNVCTADECNSLGDCKFLKDNRIINEGTAVAGGMWITSCLTASILAEVFPIPGAREGLLATAAGFCTGTAAPLWFSIYSFALLASGSIGAAASTQETQEGSAQFQLTEDGKVRLQDAILLQKSILENIDSSDYNIQTGNFGGVSGGIIGVGGFTAVVMPSLVKKIKENLGKVTPDIIQDAITWYAKGMAERNVGNILKEFTEKGFTQPTIDSLLKEGILTKEGDMVKLILDDTFVDPNIEYYVDIKVGTQLSDANVESAAKAAGKKAAEDAGQSSLHIASNVLGVLLILYSIYSLGRSFNSGECVPETAYTNNERCELCGPGEGQWFCTEERCNVLGGDIGHCKWMPNDNENTDATEDGLCLPLDVNDASPPLISSIKIEFYDIDSNNLGTFNSNSNNLNILNINEILDWDITEAKITIETNEPGECGYTKTAQTGYEETTSFYYNSPIFQTDHETNVTFTEAEKSNPEFVYIYLKCKDINDNEIINDDSYIKFKFEPRPDSDPPIIKYINPLDALLPESSQTVLLEVHAYDENRVGSCKYSSTTTNYMDMNLFTNAGIIDCNDMVPLNNKCDKFTTNIDVSTGGTEIDFSDLENGNENLQNIQGMRAFFYSIKCSDTLGNVMPIEQNWTLVVVPSFELTLNGPGGDIYDLTPTFNVSTSSATSCYYTLNNDPLQYLFDGYSYEHVVEHNTTLTPGLYSYTVHCEDFAGNVQESTGSFNVKVIPLDIISVAPNNTIIYLLNTTLEIILDGGYYDNGTAECRYSTSNLGFVSMPNTFTEMQLVNGQTKYTQLITFSVGGLYNYYIKCKDFADQENSTMVQFTVDINSPPVLIGVYTSSNMLNIILNEQSVCSYTTNNANFEFDDGTLMVPSGYTTTKLAMLGSNVYYIKCKDIYNNVNQEAYTIYP